MSRGSVEDEAFGVADSAGLATEPARRTVVIAPGHIALVAGEDGRDCLGGSSTGAALGVHVEDCRARVVHVGWMPVGYRASAG